MLTRPSSSRRWPSRTPPARILNAPQPAAQLALDQPVARLLRAAAARLEAAGCDEPRLDAELLLAAACGQSRAWLAAHGGDIPSDSALRPRLEGLPRFAENVERRAAREPVAYILGRKEFYGLDLLVDRRVLIPRPETETLVEQALSWIQHANVLSMKSMPPQVMGARRYLPPERGMALPSSDRALQRSGEGAGGEAGHAQTEPSQQAALTVVDVGTGSGAIALAIAAHTPPAVRLVAADVSPDALTVAKANAARLDLADRLTFVQSDLLAGVDAPANLIVANLPYVSRAEWAALAPDISGYEPHLALDGGADGLDLYRRLLAQVQARLPVGANEVPAPAALLLEIGWQQAAALRALVRAAFPRARVQIIPDLAGQDRVALIELRDEP